MSIKQLKIFGERHTATNAMSKFLADNIDLPQLGYGFLGWKHRLAPRQPEWSKKNLAHTLIVIMVRNPWTWLHAMHRLPYNQHMPMLNRLPFEFFLQQSIEDYETVMAMWNQKYCAYQTLCEEVPNSIVVRAEDLRTQPDSVYQNLLHSLGRDTASANAFSACDAYLNGSGEQLGKDIDKSLFSTPLLSDREAKIIDSNLDLELALSYGYQKPAR